MKRFRSSKYKKFSVENAEYLCQEVQRMEELQDMVPDDFVEALRELAEVIIWSDKNVEQVFDTFLERNMMSTLERLVTNADFSSVVKVQTIQLITMMLQNLTRKSSIYFVCSNNHLNRIISINLDESDDELFSIYVSFLKTLALRLNEDTVQFFFERETGAFPLFDRASKLLNAPDRMVRAAARQIVISVAQLSEPAITTFLERALKDVFTLISTLLLSQIHSLGEAAAAYGNIHHDPTHVTPLLSVNALSDRLEDIVDDLFYINDLFAVPHVFVPPTLECVLVEVVINPLLASLEVPLRVPSTSFASTCCLSSSALVPAPIAMCVLTRWLLLNKVGRLESLFRDRLVSQGAANGGLVGGLLKSGCMQSISGAVLLLNAMIRCGLIVQEEGEGGGEGGDATEEWTKEMGALSLMDILGEKCCTEKQFADDLLPTLKPWNAPVCEVFVDRMCRRVKRATTQPWCRSLLTALYYLITQCAFTRLCVFDVALDLFVSFVRQPREQAILFRGLLFLCLSVVRRRTKTYAEYLASRREAAGDDSDSEWLRNPYEVLFVKLENVCHLFEPTKKRPCDDLSKEASLLLPLLPCLESLQVQVVKGVHCSLDVAAASRNPEQYAAIQKCIGEVVSYRNRAAHDRLEEERNELLMWMTLRHHAYHIFDGEDKLLAELKTYGVRHRVGTTVSLCEAPRAYFRCELVKERFLSAWSRPTAAAGTPMYMVLYNTEAVFLDGGDVPARAGTEEATRLVLFAFQMIYLQAVVSHAPFSVLVTYTHPSSPMQLHMVFRHRKAAQSAVEFMTALASSCRSNGAMLVYNALKPNGCEGVGGSGKSTPLASPTQNL